MATGSKLPNSKLNLIKINDVVDVADINAISQAVETNATKLSVMADIQTGYISTSHQANVTEDYVLTFPREFTGDNQVYLLAYVSTGSPERYSITSRYVTLSSGTLTWWFDWAGDHTVYWVAIQLP